MSTTPLPPRQDRADLVQLLKTAYPNTWEQILRNSLDSLGVAALADLSPAELTQFTDHLFWLVKQTGIREPATWLATYRARVEATKASVELDSPVKVMEPIRPPKGPAKTLGALPPTLVATVTNGKSGLLSRARAAIEAGQNLRDVAEWLALAQENFHASQREIAPAIGRSASWVNRVLKWHRSGYEECSPFGPTTRAGRIAHAQQRRASKPL